MFLAYDHAARKLVATTKIARPGWTDVVAPTAAEREALVAIGVANDLLKDALDTDELSRVEHHPSGARLFVLRVPVAAEVHAKVMPLAVITLETGEILTVSRVDTGLPGELALEGCDPSEHVRFSLYLAEHVAARFVKTLRVIDADLERVEAKLRASLENDEIMSLLEHQKRLVYLDFALQENRMVLERILDDDRLALDDTQRNLVQDVLVEVRQAGAMTRTRKELLGETMDALATVVSNNLNVAMKKIASLTLLVAVPALVAGIFGMNVPLPFAETRLALPFVLALAAALTAGLAAVLHMKKWL